MTCTLILAMVVSLTPRLSAAESLILQKQATPAAGAARNLVAVKVTGTKRYAPEEVTAASGLRIGEAVDDEEFKKASRRLGDTGAFREIGYSFTYSSAGTKLEWKLIDAEKFLPARFDDFVWFTDDELRRTVKEHVPLFNGDLPLSGRLTEEVSDVLQAMLVEKGIAGHVNYLRYAREGGLIESINYRVEDILIRVRNIVFTGEAPGDTPGLESAARRLPDRQYSRTMLGLLVERQLLPVYYARGYLKAAFGVPQPKVVKEAPDEATDAPKNLTVVDVSFDVTPGQQFKVAKLEWSGNHELPLETLQSMIRLAPGQVANTVQMGDGIAQVKTLYSAKGYLTAAITPELSFDDAAGTVAIRLEVKEDAVYHMGELEFRGIDNSLTAKLRSAWTIRQGEVYDATYIKEFLPQANRLLPANIDWAVAVHVTPNIKDKTVDVDLQYAPKAPK
jgi:outer membrane protein assembly factor BamA